TSTTARRSLPPASVAWRRWMRKGSWTRASSTAPASAPPRFRRSGGSRELLVRTGKARESSRLPALLRCGGRAGGSGWTTEEHFFLADIRILERLADVPAAAWDPLHDGRNPF